MPRGAPKQFDREEVLEDAMQLFWERGYAQTGMSDLLDRMGIGRQSLYDTFGDKRTLFLEALHHYVNTRIAMMTDVLNGPGSPLANIRSTIAFYEKHNTSNNGLGCLLVNSMAEFGSDDAGLEEPIKTLMKKLEIGYRHTFQRAKKAGEIRADADPRALARSMVSMVCGVCLMGRIGMPKATIRDALRVHAQLIDSVAA
ncbi:MAG: TetR/AcrR family transcriptional regulator [Planctomycetota bacterium]|jgi:TetR/AcrR family transcriptional repressor of nem operon